MTTRPEQREQAVSAAIQVRGLTKRFGDRAVVDGVTFDVLRGDTFAFLGPNGAGKSTTIKMLTTLLRPDAGSIVIGGLDASREQRAARRQFGIVFQDCTLDTEMTVQENLWMHCVFYGVPRAARRRRLETVLEMFRLQDQRHDLAGRLSGGLKRRVEIARALLHEPPVIFLDEPTLGLDPQSRHQLWDHLTMLKAGGEVSIFLTTHYLDEVERFANRAAIIDNGRIVSQGSIAAILADAQGITRGEQDGSLPVRRGLEEAFLHLTARSNLPRDAIASTRADAD